MAAHEQISPKQVGANEEERNAVFGQWGSRTSGQPLAADAFLSADYGGQVNMSHLYTRAVPSQTLSPECPMSIASLQNDFLKDQHSVNLSSLSFPLHGASSWSALSSSWSPSSPASALTKDNQVHRFCNAPLGSPDDQLNTASTAHVPQMPISMSQPPPLWSQTSLRYITPNMSSDSAYALQKNEAEASASCSRESQSGDPGFLDKFPFVKYNIAVMPASDSPPGRVPPLYESLNAPPQSCPVCWEALSVNDPPSLHTSRLSCHGCQLQVHAFCYLGFGAQFMDYTSIWYCEMCEYWQARGYWSAPFDTGPLRSEKNEGSSEPKKPCSFADSYICEDTMTVSSSDLPLVQPMTHCAPPNIPELFRSPSSELNSRSGPAKMYQSVRLKCGDSAVFNHSSQLFKCKGTRPPALYCALCSRPGGPMKIGPEGLWVHISCVLFCQEGPSFQIYHRFQHPVKIKYFLNAHKAKQLRCALCNESFGYTVSCGFPKCLHRMHIPCAFSLKLKPFLKLFYLPKIAGDTKPQFVKIVSCPNHKESDHVREIVQHQKKLIECTHILQSLVAEQTYRKSSREENKLRKICSSAFAGYYDAHHKANLSTESIKQFPSEMSSHVQENRTSAARNAQSLYDVSPSTKRSSYYTKPPSHLDEPHSLQEKTPTYRQPLAVKSSFVPRRPFLPKFNSQERIHLKRTAISKAGLPPSLENVSSVKREFEENTSQQVKSVPAKAAKYVFSSKSDFSFKRWSPTQSAKPANLRIEDESFQLKKSTSHKKDTSASKTQHRESASTYEKSDTYNVSARRGRSIRNSMQLDKANSDKTESPAMNHDALHKSVSFPSSSIQRGVRVKWNRYDSLFLRQPFFKSFPLTDLFPDNDKTSLASSEPCVSQLVPYLINPLSHHLLIESSKFCFYNLSKEDTVLFQSLLKTLRNCNVACMQFLKLKQLPRQTDTHVSVTSTKTQESQSSSSVDDDSFSNTAVSSETPSKVTIHHSPSVQCAASLCTVWHWSTPSSSPYFSIINSVIDAVAMHFEVVRAYLNLPEQANSSIFERFLLKSQSICCEFPRNAMLYKSVWEHAPFKRAWHALQEKFPQDLPFLLLLGSVLHASCEVPESKLIQCPYHERRNILKSLNQSFQLDFRADQDSEDCSTHLYEFSNLILEYFMSNISYQKKQSQLISWARNLCNLDLFPLCQFLSIFSFLDGCLRLRFKKFFSLNPFQVLFWICRLHPAVNTTLRDQLMGEPDESAPATDFSTSQKETALDVSSSSTQTVKLSMDDDSNEKHQVDIRNFNLETDTSSTMSLLSDMHELLSRVMKSGKEFRFLSLLKSDSSFFKIKSQFSSEQTVMIYDTRDKFIEAEMLLHNFIQQIKWEQLMIYWTQSQQLTATSPAPLPSPLDEETMWETLILRALLSNSESKMTSLVSTFKEGEETRFIKSAVKSRPCSIRTVGLESSIANQMEHVYSQKSKHHKSIPAELHSFMFVPGPTLPPIVAPAQASRAKITTQPVVTDVNKNLNTSSNDFLNSPLQQETVMLNSLVWDFRLNTFLASLVDGAQQQQKLKPSLISLKNTTTSSTSPEQADTNRDTPFLPNSNFNSLELTQLKHLIQSHQNFVMIQSAFYQSLFSQVLSKLQEAQSVYVKAILQDEEIPTRFPQIPTLCASINSLFFMSSHWNRLTSYLTWGCVDQIDVDLPLTTSSKQIAPQGAVSTAAVPVNVSEAIISHSRLIYFLPSQQVRKNKVDEQTRQKFNLRCLEKTLIPPFSPDVVEVIPSFAITNSNRLKSCSVCYGGEWDSGNPIIVCTRCYVSFHRGCYGLDLGGNADGTASSHSHEDTENYMCLRCAFEKKLRNNAHGDSVNTDLKPGSIRCILCNTLGGALKRTTTAEWVHLTCALYFLPETIPRDLKTLDSWDLTNLAQWRLKATCCICHLDTLEQKGVTPSFLACYPNRVSPEPPYTVLSHYAPTQRGACLRCSYPNCNTTFHVMCAWLSGMFVDLKKLCDKFYPWASKTSQKNSATHLYFPSLSFAVYCFQHTPEKAHAIIRNQKCPDKAPPHFRSAAYQRSLRLRRFINRELYPHMFLGHHDKNAKKRGLSPHGSQNVLKNALKSTWTLPKKVKPTEIKQEGHISKLNIQDSFTHKNQPKIINRKQELCGSLSSFEKDCNIIDLPQPSSLASSMTSLDTEAAGVFNSISFVKSFATSESPGIKTQMAPESSEIVFPSKSSLDSSKEDTVPMEVHDSDDDKRSNEKSSEKLQNENTFECENPVFMNSLEKLDELTTLKNAIKISKYEDFSEGSSLTASKESLVAPSSIQKWAYSCLNLGECRVFSVAPLSDFASDSVTQNEDSTPEHNKGKNHSVYRAQLLSLVLACDKNISVQDRFSDYWCAICLNSYEPDYDEQNYPLNRINPLIRCRRCSLTVHPLCYGLEQQTCDKICDILLEPQLSSEEAISHIQQSFTCDGCLYAPPIDDLSCILCSRRGGALKAVTISLDWIPLLNHPRFGSAAQKRCSSRLEENKVFVYVHNICWCYCPDIDFHPKSAVFPDYSLERVLLSKIYNANVCQLCQKSKGICIPCSWPDCPSMNHPLCLYLNDCILERKLEQNQKLAIICYCQTHSEQCSAEISTSQILFVLNSLRSCLEPVAIATAGLHHRWKHKASQIKDYLEALQLKRPLVTCLEARYSARLPGYKATEDICEPFVPVSEDVEQASGSAEEISSSQEELVADDLCPDAEKPLSTEENVASALMMSFELSLSAADETEKTLNKNALINSHEAEISHSAGVEQQSEYSRVYSYEEKQDSSQVCVHASFDPNAGVCETLSADNARNSCQQSAVLPDLPASQSEVLSEESVQNDSAFGDKNFSSKNITVQASEEESPTESLLQLYNNLKPSNGVLSPMDCVHNLLKAFEGANISAYTELTVIDIDAGFLCSHDATPNHQTTIEKQADLALSLIKTKYGKHVKLFNLEPVSSFDEAVIFVLVMIALLCRSPAHGHIDQLKEDLAHIANCWSEPKSIREILMAAKTSLSSEITQTPEDKCLTTPFNQNDTRLVDAADDVEGPSSIPTCVITDQHSVQASETKASTSPVQNNLECFDMNLNLKTPEKQATAAHPMNNSTPQSETKSSEPKGKLPEAKEKKSQNPEKKSTSSTGLIAGLAEPKAKLREDEQKVTGDPAFSLKVIKNCTYLSHLHLSPIGYPELIEEQCLWELRDSQSVSLKKKNQNTELNKNQQDVTALPKYSISFAWKAPEILRDDGFKRAVALFALGVDDATQLSKRAGVLSPSMKESYKCMRFLHWLQTLYSVHELPFLTILFLHPKNRWTFALFYQSLLESCEDTVTLFSKRFLLSLECPAIDTLRCYEDEFYSDGSLHAEQSLWAIYIKWAQRAIRPSQRQFKGIKLTQYNLEHMFLIIKRSIFQLYKQSHSGTAQGIKIIETVKDWQHRHDDWSGQYFLGAAAIGQEIRVFNFQTTRWNQALVITYAGFNPKCVLPYLIFLYGSNDSSKGSFLWTNLRTSELIQFKSLNPVRIDLLLELDVRFQLRQTFLLNCSLSKQSDWPPTRTYDESFVNDSFNFRIQDTRVQEQENTSTLAVPCHVCFENNYQDNSHLLCRMIRSCTEESNSKLSLELQQVNADVSDILSAKYFLICTHVTCRHCVESKQNLDWADAVKDSAYKCGGCLQWSKIGEKESLLHRNPTRASKRKRSRQNATSTSKRQKRINEG